MSLPTYNPLPEKSLFMSTLSDATDAESVCFIVARTAFFNPAKKYNYAVLQRPVTILKCIELLHFSHRFLKMSCLGYHGETFQEISY